MKFCRSTALMLLGATILSLTSPASALEPTCTTFNKLLTHDGKYANEAILDGHLPGVGFSGGFSYANSNHDRLVNLSTIRNDEGNYLVVIQLIPTIDVLAIARMDRGAKDVPKEISSALSALSMTKPLRWKDNELSPGTVNQCDRLQGIIPGDEFDDGQARISIRHFVFGHRSSSGRKLCNGSNSEQMTFYETFVPYRFQLSNGVANVDGSYAGVEKGGSFEYPCLLSQLLEARTRTLSGEQVQELEPKGYPSLLHYLEQKGIISEIDRQKFESEPEGSWELQTLLNLIKGRQLFQQQ